ncbi:MAG: GerMN domain-containing protein [Peptococcaceae bacterium]|nr:GerMN domain-containing protein [Peptococcaceae bacterium]
MGFWRVKGLRLSFIVVLLTSLLTACWPLDALLPVRQPVVTPLRQGSFAPTALPVLAAGETHQRVLWLLDHSSRYVVPFVLNVPRVEGMARAAVMRLIDSPINQQAIHGTGLRLPLPSETSIRGLTIRDGVARIDFSEAFLGYTEAMEKLVVDAVVLTLTEFPNIESVQFMVHGEQVPVLPGGTETARPIRRTDRAINREPEGPVGGSTAQVLLYFTSASPENYIYFVPVTRTITQQVNLLEAVVNELIAGPPKGSGLWHDLPSAARVRGVRLNSLGIAEVDFTREIYAHGASATAETAILGAVLHTLSELPGVQGVRFTVEGRAPNFPGGSDASQPIAKPVFVNPFAL